MQIKYNGSIKKFNVYQNNKLIAKLSKKNPCVEVDEGTIKIKEVITGIKIVDFFLYGIIGFFDIFSNYVDGDLIDCNIFLITNTFDIKKDEVIDDYGMCDGGKYKLRTVVFKASLCIYTIIFFVANVVLLYFGQNASVALQRLFILFSFLFFICYFYIVVNLVHTYNRYKKFLIERIGDYNGQ